ncbi:DUF2147 domain-containing protein [Schleiferia thermophila]|jgi:uncharacterized protein (DUF2147 family)|uniref:Uncharacterized protein DUF2147 n=1 Tax=Schleiferia thermophila TaxID=884107 RepID=A0A368ZZE4_9FLAO|nr:DUF2147 domain-containing protein [Schleiferia thermophila]RCX02325.1 uncharacterized protein DUF2147 [Schleiferia thermophila]
MKKIRFFLSLLVLPLFCMTTANAQNVEGDKLIGVWEPSHGKARVKIEKIGDKYYGKIVWLREPIDPVTNQPKVDKNNPDESMRQVPLKGYRILKDFVYNDKGEWVDGTIYDPENGNTYSCVIKMKDENTLDIRGYIGVKALGRTDVWTRVAVKKKD